MSKGKFGGTNYKPKQLGPEPAAASPVAGPAPARSRVKVQYSSRVTVEAEAELKAMARDGRSQTELLAEALNLLFKKHGRAEVA